MSEKIYLDPMPELWSAEHVIVSHKALAGAFAHWAVFQSPYVVPERLGEAVAEFMSHWAYDDYSQFASYALERAIEAAIEESPLVKAWNEPKVAGAVNSAGFASVSRYDTIKPDYDFIDLGALAHNVAHELTLWHQVERAQDAFRDGAGEPVKGCGICGNRMVAIRGKHPGDEERTACPTCATERLEQIQQISSPDYGATASAVAE